MNFDDLLDKFDARLRKAFLAGVNEITSKAQLNQVAKALERGNIQEAVDALFIDEAAYAEFDAVLREAFGEGGAVTVDELGQLRDQSGLRFVFRFDGRNLAAERIIREYSSQRIQGIVEGQKEAARLALTEGLERGANPATTALDIVGRIDRRTKQRTGGILGLSKPQERAVSSARSELENGNYSNYLQRAKRDKRFDSVVRKAIENDAPLNATQIKAITQRYSDRLLKLRGDTIARTETLAALNLAKYESIEQLIATGKVRQNQVSLSWDASRDGRTRLDHLSADGQMINWGERFRVGGRLMKHPGDPAGGADQIINCRCAMRININYATNR